MTLIGPIAAGAKRDWRVTIDGHVLDQVRLLVIESERFGRLTYGWTPGGYDGWSFRVAHSGGAVVAPFALIGGIPHVGVVEQLRHNQGGMVLNVPRGFREDEPYQRAAARELHEETGHRVSDEDCVELQGAPINPDGSFFDTSGSDEGVRFFAVRVDPGLLEAGEHGLRMRTASKRALESQREEKIASFRFLPWTEVARLADMFSVACVGRLIAHLIATGELALSVGAAG